jgi:hypothetical protein
MLPKQLRELPADLAAVLDFSSVVYAIAVPPQGEQFTEFYVLTEDSDGELVAAHSPQNFTVWANRKPSTSASTTTNTRREITR